MTDSGPAPSPTRQRTVRANASTTKRRRSYPAAASRVLVTGLSVAATLALASAMATPEISDQPSATFVPNGSVAAPASVALSASDLKPVTTSHAS